MKKIIFALAALATLASCSNDEVIEIDRKAISFGETFVDNATRADYSSGVVVNKFKVYGTVTGNDNTVQIFNGDDVINPTSTTGSYGSAWNYTNVQYWLPNASYKFAAIVDGAANTTSALPETIPFTVTDGDGDLLYATADVTTNANAEPAGGVNTASIVAFNFKHLLSKLQFTIANGTSDASGYSYQVTGISVSGVAAQGTYTTSSNNWAKNGDTTTTLTFGSTAAIAGGAEAVATETRQILPVNQTLAITITYDTLVDGTTIVAGQTKTGNITQAFAANTVYNVTATLTANEIDFTLQSVNDWVSGGDI